MTNKVYSFINKFTDSHNLADVEYIFTNGCCYWFAYILHARFPGSTIMYNALDNHFATLIDGVLYDITGEIQNNSKWIPWDDYSDTTHKNRITEYCIDFTKS